MQTQIRKYTDVRYGHWRLRKTVSPEMPLWSGKRTVATSFSSARYQSSIGENEEVLSYKPNDVRAIPCWCAHAFAVTEESVLFSGSDRGLQEQLGIWRERRS
jgi:gentisate 1,2-dioxygenase